MKKALFLLVLIGVGVGGYFGYQRYTVATEPAIQLVTAEVTMGDVVQGIDATGRLEAVRTVQVGSQVSGTIKALYADFNTQVRSGQVVAELEPSLFETQVEQAKASLVRMEADIERTRVQLEDARLKLDRARDLSKRNLLPRADLETAEANARTAEASLKSAEAQLVQGRASLNQSEVNLSHTVIRAPSDGVVILRNVNVGQTVAASMQAPVLFEIANDLTQMQVSANIDESDIGGVANGQAVSFGVDAYPGERFSGTVRQVRLNPVIQSNVVSYVTIIDVPNPDLRLKPGMTANVTVEVARANETLRVPASALRFSPTPEIFASLGQTPPEATSSVAVTATGDGEDASASAPASGDTPAFRGGGGFGGSDADREALRARMAQMSPEEREALFAGRGGRTGGRGGRSGGRNGGAPPQAGAANVERPGQVWAVVDGKLQVVDVRVGISDGANVAVSGGGLQEGVVVATGMVQTVAAVAAPPAGGNPLIPQFGRGRGGFGGGGNRGGGRGN